MHAPSRILSAFAALAALALFCGNNSVWAQVGDDAGGTTTNASTGTGLAAGEGLSLDEPDLSKFDGLDRSATTSFGGEGLTGNTGTTTARGGGGAGGGIGGFGGLGGFFGGLSQAFGGAGQGSATKPAVRVRLRSAVQVAPLSNGEIQVKANRTLAQVPRRMDVQGVQVYVEQGTAVLDGTVRTEKDRRMSELLMRLEPGVRRVENRLTVAP